MLKALAHMQRGAGATEGVVTTVSEFGLGLDQQLPLMPYV